MTRGYKCPECERFTVRKLPSGAWECGNPGCRTVSWDPFDIPKGRPGGQSRCDWCSNKSVVKVADVGRDPVTSEVWRCGYCGATRVVPL
jgi:ribosomal protein L37AE/L43A